VNTSPKCAACGGSNLEPGKLSGVDRTAFIPNKSRSKWRCFRVTIAATSCADCGAIALSADPDKLRAAVGEEK
jgi:hypothetical protein